MDDEEAFSRASQSGLRPFSCFNTSKTSRMRFVKGHKPRKSCRCLPSFYWKEKEVFPSFLLFFCGSDVTCTTVFSNFFCRYQRSITTWCRGWLYWRRPTRNSPGCSYIYPCLFDACFLFFGVCLFRIPKQPCGIYLPYQPFTFPQRISHKYTGSEITIAQYWEQDETSHCKTMPSS